MGTRLVVRLLVVVGVLIGLLGPAGRTAPANAATSHADVYSDNGVRLGSATFNSGRHAAHSHKSDVGFNSFVLVDSACGDGLKVGVTWVLDYKRHDRAAPIDCTTPRRRQHFSFRTHQSSRVMRPITWYAWVEDEHGKQRYVDKKLHDDWMGSFSADKSSKYFTKSSVYNDVYGNVGRTFTASLWPTRYASDMGPLPDTGAVKAIWKELIHRTPLPSDLTRDQTESMFKQLWCHAAYANAPNAVVGSTWDLESARKNIPWNKVRYGVRLHKCNWGDNDPSYDHLPGDPDQPPADRTPVVDAGSDVSGNEGSAVRLTGQAVDDHGRPATRWTYRPLKGVDAGARCTFSAAKAVKTKVTCTDDGRYVVTLTADDGVNRPVSDSAVVSVRNVAPRLKLTAPRAWQVYRVNDRVAIAASFTDPGSNDSHTCQVSWDDGTRSTFDAKHGGCDRTRRFAHAGMYTMKVTVTDDDGGTDSASVMAVAYDPRAGLVTGTGSVDDLAFTEVAKYLTISSTTPVGAVTLRVPTKNGTLRPVTTELAWLVITPDGKTAVKGAAGDHGFVLYATGAKVRAVVWPLSHGDVPTGRVSYDTVPGASYDVDEARPRRLSLGLTVIDSGWVPGLPLPLDVNGNEQAPVVR